MQVNYEFCSVSHLASGNEIKVLGHPKMEEQILRSIFWEVRKRISRKGKFIKDMENVALCKTWNIEGKILV